METDFFAKNKNRIIVFSIVFFAILIKSLYFNYYVLGEVLPSSGEPIMHFLYRLTISLSMQVSAALFFASFVLLIRKDIWVLIVNVIIDLWIMSNQIYYQLNDLFIFVDIIKLAGNLGDSNVVGSTINNLSGCIIYPLLTILSYIAIWQVNKRIENISKKINFKYWIIAIVFSIVGVFVSYLNDWRIFYYHQSREEYGTLGYKCFIPYHSIIMRYSIGDFESNSTNWPAEYTEQYSIYHYFSGMFVFDMLLPDNSDIIINEDEVNPFLSGKSVILNDTVNGPLIILLVESLESWTINGNGQISAITKNLSSFSHNENVLYCNRIKSQVKHGVSGDGQMIVNTGLLPTISQTACQFYGDNFYPNFAHHFKYAKIVNPWAHIWNQDVVTYKYGYKGLIETSDGHVMSDIEVINNLLNEMEERKGKMSTCILALTIETHLPFGSSNKRNMKFDDSISPVISDYLNCLSYTDSCIGLFIDKLLSDTFYSNATVIITGDHTVFKSSQISDVKKVNGINRGSLSDDCTYVPLYVYSPKIQKNRFVTDVCYQMDIYPTIIDLIGVKNYFWKGFGISLINEKTKRKISEDKASELSDRIIRSDYFAKRLGMSKEKK